MDTLANMLTKIRNAQNARHETVEIPFSKMKLSIANLLQREGFVGRVEVRKGDRPGIEYIVIALRYVRLSPTESDPAIRGIRRVSRSGQRVYVKRDEIRRVKNGYGVAIVSTPKGLMTGVEARRSGLGGEYVCEVW